MKNSKYFLSIFLFTIILFGGLVFTKNVLALGVCEGANKDTAECDNSILAQFISENSIFGLTNADVMVNRNASGRIILIQAYGQGSKIQSFGNLLSLTALTNLNLALNKISGSLPTISSPLTNLALYQNKLTGGYSNLGSVSGLTFSSCNVSSNHLNKSGGPGNCHTESQTPVARTFITQINPKQGPVGTSVTLGGSGFSSGNNVVKFGSLSISGVSATGPQEDQITFSVPAGVANGSYQVSVENENGVNPFGNNGVGDASNYINFTVGAAVGGGGGVTAAQIQASTTVSQGSTGSSALTWQRFLNTYNNAGLVEDGNFGPLSVAEAKEWQASKNLVVDGMLGAISRSTAVNQINAASTTTPPPTPTPISCTSTSASTSSSSTGVTYKMLKLLPDYIDANGTYPNAGSGNASILSVNQAGLTLNTMFPFVTITQNEKGGQCDAGDKTCKPVTAGALSKGNFAGPRTFSLSDPLNPTVNRTKTWNINTDNDAFGDYGPTLRVDQGVALSADGAYGVARSSQRYLFFFHDGERKVMTGNERANDFAGIVQSGGNTYFVGHSRIINMTNFGTTPNPMPANTPTLSYTGIFDRSIILGDMFAKVSFGEAGGGKSGASGTAPSLKLYSFSQSSPVADYTLPATVANVAGGAATGFVAPDGTKYVILGAGAKVFIYQISGSKFVPVAEDITLPGVAISGSELGTNIVGVILNGKKAVMTFNSASSVSPKIFLLSDLTKNVAGSVSASLGRVDAAAAYVKGSTTYVYTSSVASGQARELAVWSLSGAGSGGSTTPPNNDCITPVEIKAENVTCAVSVGGSIVYYTSTSGSCNQ